MGPADGPWVPRVVLLLLLLLGAPVSQTITQEPLVVLKQGTLRGIRVFSESRQPIMAFLGIPYAAPPIGDLRFAAPERHPGWNGSLFAGSWRPPCPQPAPAPSLPAPAEADEDCLTLNVWAPDTPHYRPLPVLVLVEGEEFVAGAPQRFPGHDLAAEGLVVVSVAYRLNVFGFLALGDINARGNLGLLDQYVALLWVRENIALFRGDPNAVTLMGHGAGAAAVAMHLTSPRTAGLVQRAVLMSGSAASPWTRARPLAAVAKASRGLARKLGCLLPSSAAGANAPSVLLACLRAKPAAELLRAFEAQYQGGNWSELVGPVVDDFLPEEGRYLARDPLQVLQESGAPVPVLTGVTSAEGSYALNQWSDVLQQGGAALRLFLEQTALPQALRRYGLLQAEGAAGAGAGADAAARALAWWRYAEVQGAAEGETNALRAKLMQLASETRALAPHGLQLRLLARSPGQRREDQQGQQDPPGDEQQQQGRPAPPVFAYAFTQPGAPDPFAHASSTPQQHQHHQQHQQQQQPLDLLGGGAAHGADLLFLLGPSALVQVTGLRPTPAQERLSKSLKRLWVEFARRGEPTAGGFGYGLAWRRFGGSDGDWADLREAGAAAAGAAGAGPAAAPATAAAAREADAFWNGLLPRVQRLTAAAQGGGDGDGDGAGTAGPQRGRLSDASQAFRSATYTLAGFVVALLLLLVACAVLLRRRAREREHDAF